MPKDHSLITSKALRDGALRKFVEGLASNPNRQRACSGHLATRVFLQYKTGRDSDGRYAQTCLTKECPWFKEVQYLSDPLTPEELVRLRNFRADVDSQYMAGRRAGTGLRAIKGALSAYRPVDGLNAMSQISVSGANTSGYLSGYKIISFVEDDKPPITLDDLSIEQADFSVGKFFEIFGLCPDDTIAVLIPKLSAWVIRRVRDIRHRHISRDFPFIWLKGGVRISRDCYDYLGLPVPEVKWPRDVGAQYKNVDARGRSFANGHQCGGGSDVTFTEHAEAVDLIDLTEL